MPNIQIKPGRVAVAEWLHAKFPIEREAVPRQWKGVRINTLALDPRADELYRTAVHFARRFIHDMRLQGFELLTNEADLLITGPFPHLEADTGGRAIGRHFGQEQTEQYADFRITGQFLRTRPVTFEYRDIGATN
ncbi:MAG: hypothetical protein NUW01_20170 [Gemmatimonadaceae bacterium]|nr:hypothetical protein [Gemmatimonadaceae bacterium]